MVGERKRSFSRTDCYKYSFASVADLLSPDNKREHVAKDRRTLDGGIELLDKLIDKKGNLFEISKLSIYFRNRVAPVLNFENKTDYLNSVRTSLNFIIDDPIETDQSNYDLASNFFKTWCNQTYNDLYTKNTFGDKIRKAG